MACLTGQCASLPMCWLVVCALPPCDRWYPMWWCRQWLQDAMCSVFNTYTFVCLCKSSRRCEDCCQWQLTHCASILPDTWSDRSLDISLRSNSGGVININVVAKATMDNTCSIISHSHHPMSFAYRHASSNSSGGFIPEPLWHSIAGCHIWVYMCAE